MEDKREYNNNYTKAAPGFWGHPRQIWSHSHPTRSPEDSPLYDLQDSAQMSVPSFPDHPTSNHPTPAFPVPPYPNLIFHLSYYTFTCLLSLPTSESRAFLWGGGLLLYPKGLEQWHRAGVLSRWLSMRWIQNIYTFHDFSPWIGEVLLNRVRLTISIPESLFISQSSTLKLEVLQTLTDTHLKPSLEGAHSSIKALRATIKSLSTDVSSVLRDFPQGFNFHLVPLAYFAMAVLSHILALGQY